MFLFILFFSFAQIIVRIIPNLKLHEAVSLSKIQANIIIFFGTLKFEETYKVVKLLSGRKELAKKFILYVEVVWF